MVQQILRMDRPELVANGVGVAFDLVTAAGTQRLAIPVADLGKMLQFFGSMATLTEDDGKPPTEDLFPISISGLGYQEGETPDTSVLVARIGAVFLALEMPRSELANTAQKALLAASKKATGSHLN